MANCIQCSKYLKEKARKYCNGYCQSKFVYSSYIKKWKNGEASGLRGITTFNISAHVIRYIHEKYGYKCSLCGWNEKNPYTKHCPLEIDHINGDALDNQESNLRLLCPNCHSLTKTYKNSNLSNGRLWRREKYVKIVDVPL